MKAPLEAGEETEMNSPLEQAKQPSHYLDFSSVRPVSDF